MFSARILRILGYGVSVGTNRYLYMYRRRRICMEREYLTARRESLLSKTTELLQEVMRTAEKDEKFVGVYRARENGHSKILTAPRAVLKQNYAMFESACGILVYVPISPLQEDVEENKED